MKLRRILRRVPPHLALALSLLAGCSENLTESTPEPQKKTTQNQHSDHSDSALKIQDGPTFDFGPVVARDQTLTHDFKIENPTDNPIYVTSAISWMPCCSKILPVAGPIPAKGTGKLTVEFKPGFQTGKRRLTFEVHTNEPDSPGLGFAISAELTSAMDLRRLDGSDSTLSINRPGRQSFEVICRKVGNEGRGPLTSIEATPPLRAEFDGPAVESTSASSIVTSTRKVTIDLPASATVGQQRGEYTLVWADGTRKKQSIDWVVAPVVSVNPPGFTLRASEGRTIKEILIRSTDRPFRLLGVSGPLLATEPQPSAEPSKLHQLKLDLDVNRAASSATSEIVLKTDHPDHPTLNISLLILPESRGTSP